MTRVLLLGSGTQALAVINAIRRSAEYVALASGDKGNYADHSRFVNRVYHDATLTDNARVDFVNGIINSDQINVIIPMGDDDAEFLSKNVDRIDKRASFKLPGYEDFIRGYDKNQLMTLCCQKGYPHPDTIDLSLNTIDCREVRDFSYPAMLKPNRTTGGRGMEKVNSYEELVGRYALLHSEFGDYHLQKLIAPGGKQEKIQLYVDGYGNLVAHSALQKVRWYPLTGGSNCCGISVEDMKMVQICYNILKDINWVGFADFDLIENPETGEMLIMELNPRVPACIKGAIVAGVNWAEIIEKGYLGLPQRQYYFRTGIVLRHLGLDLLWFLKSPDRWKAKPCWLSFFGERIHYQDMSHWSDQVPFIMGTIHNIKKLFNPEFKRSKSI